MSLSAVNDSTLYLGIDGGGTKCRASLVSPQDEVLGLGLAGPANPMYGLTKALPSIIEAAEQAVLAAGLNISELNNVVAGVALAGVNLPSMFQALSKWQHPFAKMYLTTDLHAACLGAHSGKDGAVIVTGTGSCGFVQAGGRIKTLGGHGFLMGDKGSGAWMGLEAVKAVLTARDGLAQRTCLAAHVNEIYRIDELEIIERMNRASPSDFARLAPMILAAANNGDTVAMSIVCEGARYIDALARQLLTLNPPRFSMIGGVSQPLQKWLSKDVVEKIMPPLEQPEMGAVHYAREQHQKQNRNAVFLRTV